MGANWEVAEMAKKVMRKPQEEVEAKGPKLSAPENGRAGKSKIDCFVWLFGRKIRECSDEEGMILADSVETLWSGLENESQEVGSQRKSEKEINAG